MGVRARLSSAGLAILASSFAVGGFNAHAATSQPLSAARPAQTSPMTSSPAATPGTLGPPGAPLGGRISCAVSNFRCLDMEYYQSVRAFGHYVGHDEPSNPFYSTIAGSGTQDRWQVRIPRDPVTQPTRSNGVAWNFMLHPAFWFGMAMCNDESSPEVHTTIGSCVPGSDSNIADCNDPTGTACTAQTGGYIGNHVGAAYMEFQFYPPGWAPLIGNAPVGGESCDATKWCAAMVIWSLQQNGDGTVSNKTDCVNNSNGGVEFGNASFITLGATSQSPVPASPYNNPGAFSPTPSADQFYNQGDVLTVSMHDIPNGTPASQAPNGTGLEITVNDQTTGTVGHTVASGTGPNNNGFTTLKWDPTSADGASCTVIPYNFHPMYSTTNLHTRVPWAAHTYNIDFTDEIGHFDYCTNVTVNNSGSGGCAGNEGPSTDSEPAETPAANSFLDDSVCYDGTTAGTTTLVPLGGCLGTNLPGFDGVPYQPNTWPDGNFTLRPEPIRYTSPLTGPNYNQNYADYAFESNLPALEFIVSLSGGASSCDIATGIGCTQQPPTDDNTAGGTQFGFYPWFSIDQHDPSQCWWLIGQDVAGQTSNDFNSGVPDSQYGPAYHAAGYEFNESPPVTLPLVENFHTVGTPTDPNLLTFANPNPCSATATSPGVVTPEAPMVPLLAFAAGGAIFVGMGVRRRWMRHPA
jgi:hypothetical protein